MPELWGEVSGILFRRTEGMNSVYRLHKKYKRDWVAAGEPGFEQVCHVCGVR